MSAETPRLLLVDDDVSLTGMLREFLELQGFHVDALHEGERVLQRVADDPPDLIVLDVMLPDISGFEVLKQLRETHDLPVIMLTARGTESERIIGLFGGADDYVPKPCSPLELTARIRAVLKRTLDVAAGPSSPVTAIGPLRLDSARRELKVNDESVSVTTAELRVLEELMKRAGVVMTRGELTRRALDRPSGTFDRSIDTLVSKLRGKLAAAGVDGRCLRGVRGHGYVFDDSTFAQD